MEFMVLKRNGKMILNQVPGNNIIDSENIESRPDIENNIENI